MFFPIEIFRRGDGNLVEPLGREFFEEEHQILRRLEGQRADQQRIDQAEDGRVRGDGERDGDHGDEGEAGCLDEAAKSEAEFLEHRSWLFGAERGHGVGACGPPRWNPAGEQGHNNQKKNTGEERDRIARGNAVEPRFEQAAEEKGDARDRRQRQTKPGADPAR